MELQHLIAKLFVEGELKLAPERCVDVFHRWVADQSAPEMLIDVAELLHVPDGPGVIAVGHEGDYALDHSEGRWGILYRRKVELEGSNADRVAQAIQAASAAATRLEAEFGDELKFNRREIELIINDRALAPNTPETYAQLQDDLKAGIAAFLGNSDFEIEPQVGDPRRRFAVTVRTAQPFKLAAAAK